MTMYLVYDSAIIGGRDARIAYFVEERPEGIPDVIEDVTLEDISDEEKNESAFSDSRPLLCVEDENRSHFKVYQNRGLWQNNPEEMDRFVPHDTSVYHSVDRLPDGVADRLKASGAK
jgi:hypothetical protein